jgi:8-oxo-dGTP diphosphatase
MFKDLIIKLVRIFGLFAYRYTKANNTATVVLLFDGGTKALVIERLHDPYKGKLCFPGGFLNADQEDIPTCAERELKEETSLTVRKQDLKPVDVRSRPDRDPRGHVIDHGFAYHVPAALKDQFLQQLKAADDAADARIVDVSELLQDGVLGFDHKELLEAAIR